jgi:competence protein ComEC
MLRVTFLDVGQGDATLVQFPTGESMLVDAGGLPGGSIDPGERYVAPAVWALGVRKLDVLALTHGDPDHIGGAASVIRDLRPREVWEGVPVPPHAPLGELREAARRARSDWRTILRGARRTIGGVDLAARHPPPPDWERQSVRNDDSLVLDLRFGAVSIVLPGDIGQDVEAEAVRDIPPAPLRVVKVPHHGSAASSSDVFVRTLAPSVAIVSAGRGNRFGHPAPRVVARYRAAGAAVFRTDRHGAVTVETDGRRLRVHTMTGLGARD